MSETIVLIDDDKDDLDLLREAIHTHYPTMNCISFLQPKEAMRVVCTELVVVPQYIFIDINMPEMRGTECVKAFRSNHDFDKTTIAVISTGVNEHAVQEMIDIGANFVFRKPNLFNGYEPILRQVLKSA